MKKHTTNLKRQSQHFFIWYIIKNTYLILYICTRYNYVPSIHTFLSEINFLQYDYIVSYTTLLFLYLINLRFIKFISYKNKIKQNKNISFNNYIFMFINIFFLLLLLYYLYYLDNNIDNIMVLQILTITIFVYMYIIKVYYRNFEKLLYLFVYNIIDVLYIKIIINFFNL